ncbi:MAG: molybdopterin-dependent oxidoreductase [Betaproteobacteria bacterium]|nr:molybdopterin-dependent oxidoreductase [Betaproteobacteria bacterium]
MSVLDNMDRRTFLKTTAAAGATGAALTGAGIVFESEPAKAQGPAPETKIVKNVCHQCPARCGIDVYVTEGRVHAIYGTLDHPISNGKLCPKGHLGAYILYDPDRFKGPMKRTNPAKGRNEDPKWQPIGWDEALGIVAARLNVLRDKGEPHRFAIAFGRGWGESDAGLLGTFGKLYGTPNAALNHSSICSDGSKKAKLVQDGNYGYNAYDYANTNYLLNFGASFLEAYRPFSNNLQAWGHMRTKSPKTKVAVVDVRLTTTGAAADHLLLVKPGTDGALALALAHRILTRGWWDRKFAGDFADGVNRFRRGEEVDPATFNEKWVKGLVEWWNAELKDRTPEWAAGVTTVPERDIEIVAREFGTTRPAMAIFERGPTTHTNGLYNGMAIHALNALVGSMYAEGGLMNQMGVPYGKLPMKADDFLDEAAKAAAARKMPKLDGTKTKDNPLASNNIQGIAENILAGKPYKIDTMMFYLTNPIFSALEVKKWEEALKTVFVIETSPFPSETSLFADLVLPDHTFLERLQDTPTYPFQGFPLTNLRVPAVKPLHDTKQFSDTLIEIGKRIKGPMGEYYKKLGNTENVIKVLAKGFEANPGDNGVDSYEKWVEKGVWYRKPYAYRQVAGEFLEWDGLGYAKPMLPEDVKKKLFKTESGRFELKSSYLEHYADFVSARLGIPKERVGFPQWLAPKYTGGGDLHFITPKTAMHAEGRSGNSPHAIGTYQPNLGGRNELFLEIHPDTAAKRGIRSGDRVRISNQLGAIAARARIYPGCRPDTVVLPFGFGHWAHGRWATSRKTGNGDEIIPNVSEPVSGLAAYYTVTVNVEKA